jgi:hypothetical protein
MNQVPFCSKIPAFTPKNPIYVHTITCLRSVLKKTLGKTDPIVFVLSTSGKMANSRGKLSVVFVFVKS